MKVLIAEDELISNHILQEMLQQWGYEVICTTDGDQAWQILQQPDAPQLVLLDWVMPNMSGVEVCKRVRQHESGTYTYILILTEVKVEKRDVVHGLETGADDYLTKPYNPQELKARLDIGKRILTLEKDLREKNNHLEHLVEQRTKQLVKSLERERFIRQTLEILNHTVDTETVIRELTEEMGRFFKVDRCLLWSFDEHKRPIISSQYCHLDAFPPINPNDVPFSSIEPFIQDRLDKKHNVLMNIPMPSHFPVALQPYIHQYKIQSLLVFNISYQGHAYGRLTLHRCQEAREWDEDDIALVENILPYIGIALHQAKVFQQQQYAMERLESTILSLM